MSSADIPLASSFFNTDSASAFLDSSAAFFSAATFFASALESSFTATFKADFCFQLFFQYADIVR